MTDLIAENPFENVRDQIGCCGIYCGSCVMGNGVLRELTARYRRVLDDYSFEEWAPAGFDFSEFMKGLSAIVEIPLCHGCQKGDGAPDCTLRACAQAKGVADCVECGLPDDCPHIERREVMRKGAAGAGLKVKEYSADRETLIKEWLSELRLEWPTGVLFLSDL